MAKSDDNLTPAMKQFHHFKQKYADAVLFFRMGDFYETFFEDAHTCSRVLGLTLTQPAHLQIRAGRILDADQRDSLRAEIIRTRLCEN
jgi:DNA mismatch repair ATPase MutS